MKTIGVFFGNVKKLNSLVIRETVNSTVRLVNDDGAVIGKCPVGQDDTDNENLSLIVCH